MATPTDDKAKAASTYNAASDSYDLGANAFCERFVGLEGPLRRGGYRCGCVVHAAIPEVCSPVPKNIDPGEEKLEYSTADIATM
jgi:hypothetical protein